ncbi:MAG TPA: hypothetical protein VFO46_00455 [Candidatus Sulfotelmatobacter sp.]|nr:hypothetical protein [Candidatus Sulfotelmatobacter sp.]
MHLFRTISLSWRNQAIARLTAGPRVLSRILQPLRNGWPLSSLLSRGQHQQDYTHHTQLARNDLYCGNLQVTITGFDPWPLSELEILCQLV